MKLSGWTGQPGTLTIGSPALDFQSQPLEKILQALPPLPPRQTQQGHQVLIEQIENDVGSGLRSAERGSGFVVQAKIAE
jgi:hypothetical protein